MTKFAKKHLDELERVPAAFLSVTLSEAGAERTSATPEEHGRFTADVQKMLDIFQKQTGWSVEALAETEVTSFVELGLLEDTGESVRLTRRGRCVADSVVSSLFNATSVSDEGE